MSSPKEKLNRASFTLMESIKDYTISSLMSAIQSNKIKLTPAQSQDLQTFLTLAIEAGYHRGSPGFGKEVDGALSDTKKW